MRVDVGNATEGSALVMVNVSKSQDVALNSAVSSNVSIDSPIAPEVDHRDKSMSPKPTTSVDRVERPGHGHELPSGEATSQGALVVMGSAPVGKSLRRELFWVLPLGLAAIGATIYMLSNRRWGADAAAILAFPVSLAGIVVAVLIERGVFRRSALQVPRERRRAWHGAAALIATVLAGTLVAWWVQREGDPFDYLSGDVRIGYTSSSSYSGWHVDQRGIPTGFDIDIAHAIESHFKVAHITWVDVGNLNNRIAALQGKWRDASNMEQKPVKLVISNFSMSPQRAEQIDFAGPYFVDSQGFLAQRGITSIADVPVGQSVCVLEGSSSADRLLQYGWRPVERKSLAACVSEFRIGRVSAVSGDRSALAGFASSARWAPPIDLKFGAEKYGVGMPNNMPRLCAELSKVIDDFIVYQWATAFHENLERLGLKRADYSTPRSTDPCEQPAPWYQG